MNVLVIGAGNMGLTYAEGMAKSKVLNNSTIMLMDTSEEILTKLDEMPHFETHNNLNSCVPKANIIFLAVKPYHAEGLLSKMKPLVNPQQIVISIMAGVNIEMLKESLGIHKIIRGMPNLPAKIGKGLTSYVSSKEISEAELFLVKSLLETTGKSINVNNEKLIDASTGISGSGPAYVFYFMKSMMEAAQQMGFNSSESKILVSQTFEGAVKLFNESSLSASSWMEKVASKGGTTRAALDSMEGNKVNELIQEAAFSAFYRAMELGKEYQNA